MRISDWSSDVCSSDLLVLGAVKRRIGGGHPAAQRHPRAGAGDAQAHRAAQSGRGDERQFTHPPANGFGDLQRLRLVDIQRHRELVAAVAHGVSSEEHTSELQSLMRISSAVFCLKKKTQSNEKTTTHIIYTYIH